MRIAAKEHGNAATVHRIDQRKMAGIRVTRNVHRIWSPIRHASRQFRVSYSPETIGARPTRGIRHDLKAIPLRKRDIPGEALFETTIADFALAAMPCVKNAQLQIIARRQFSVERDVI